MRNPFFLIERRTMFPVAITLLMGWIFLFNSCSKGGSDSPDPCTGVSIIINGTVTHTTGPGNSNGSIVVTATGGSSFQFSINGGAFQTSGTFASLAAGTYTISARSSAGCSATATFTVNVGDLCTGKTITIATTLTASDKCGATGSVTVTASGSTGFTYRLNASGTYQASNAFANVAAGNHVVFVRDADGCEKTENITIAALANGPQFGAVATLLRTKCAPCHTTQSEGGANYTTDCGIVSLADRIKARAVDIGDMPQGGPTLSAADKATITNWITGGGRSSN